MFKITVLFSHLTYSVLSNFQVYCSQYFTSQSIHFQLISFTFVKQINMKFVCHLLFIPKYLFYIKFERILILQAGWSAIKRYAQNRNI